MHRLQRTQQVPGTLLLPGRPNAAQCGCCFHRSAASNHSPLHPVSPSFAAAEEREAAVEKLRSEAKGQARLIHKTEHKLAKAKKEAEGWQGKASACLYSNRADACCC